MERLTINAKQLLQAIKLHVICGAPIEVLNYRQDYVGIRYSKANGYYMLAGDIYVTYEGGSTGKSIRDFRFLLRPLSQLTEEIEHNSISIQLEPNLEKIIPSEFIYKHWFYTIREDGHFSYHIGDGTVIGSLYRGVPYSLIDILLEWHFDVFGLIDKGLALPIDGKEVEGE